MHISKSTNICTRLGQDLNQVHLTKASRETNILSDCTFAKESTIYRIIWRDVSFNLMLVSRSEINSYHPKRSVGQNPKKNKIKIRRFN